MDKDNHVTDDDLEELHQPPGGESGKGCLIRHKRPKREENNLCSHQWQAQIKAESDPKLYNYPAYISLCGPGKFKAAVRISKAGNQFPYDYAKLIGGLFLKDKPTHEGREWDIGKNDNFNHFLKPYWHNAHHIVPNGALQNAINNTSKDDARLPNLIRYCLLKASYNLNDKVNMIILPQEKIVAEALGLPRHLKGDEVGPNEKGEFFSHVDYSGTIQNKLDKIMVKYKKALASALKSHPKPPGPLSKDKLEYLSRKIYESIRNISPHDAGKALSELDL